MEEFKNLTEDEFWDLYCPIDSGKPSMMWDYEPTKEYPITQVWTLYDKGEITYAIPGYVLIANRTGYTVTRKPWTTTLIEGVWYKP
jgi:hypothetical protein